VCTVHSCCGLLLCVADADNAAGDCIITRSFITSSFSSALSPDISLNKPKPSQLAALTRRSQTGCACLSHDQQRKNTEIIGSSSEQSSRLRCFIQRYNLWFYSPVDFTDASNLHQTVVKFIGESIDSTGVEDRCKKLLPIATIYSVKQRLSGARPERTMSSLGKKSRLAMFSLQASCHGAAMLTTKNDIIIYALIFDE